MTLKYMYMVVLHKYNLTMTGRPKAALRFWFFGDFGCGASIFIVIRVIYKYRNR